MLRYIFLTSFLFHESWNIMTREQPTPQLKCRRQSVNSKDGQTFLKLTPQVCDVTREVVITAAAASWLYRHSLFVITHQCKCRHALLARHRLHFVSFVKRQRHTTTCSTLLYITQDVCPAPTLLQLQTLIPSNWSDRHQDIRAEDTICVL